MVTFQKICMSKRKNLDAWLGWGWGGGRALGVPPISANEDNNRCVTSNYQYELFGRGIILPFISLCLCDVISSITFYCWCLYSTWPVFRN